QRRADQGGRRRLGRQAARGPIRRGASDAGCNAGRVCHRARRQSFHRLNVHQKNREIMVHALSSRRALIVVIVAAIAAGLAWRHAHTNGAAIAVAPEAAPVPVRSAVVQRQDMPIYLTGVGTVTANQSVTVKVRVDGELDKVAFTEGQDVKAGQVLAQIDPRPFQAQLQQAVATEARDQAQLANARRDQQRYARLIKEDATTRQQLDTQNALVSQLEAAVQMDAAQVSYAKVQLGYTTITAP